MNFLTNILYWISTSLMIPVIVVLLISLVMALFMLGGFYSLYINRLKHKNIVREFLNVINDKNKNIIEEVKIKNDKTLFFEYIKKLINVNWHGIHSEKIIADFEIAGEKELESSKSLMRLGPMLGLMGTLIPMGPALVGLASGDIASMAVNMQVAFSTTVVGIFIGAIGYITQLVKQRWYVEDLNNLQYIYELMTEAESNETK
jgi:biopolymer transport protein ExbB/TolQ